MTQCCDEPATTDSVQFASRPSAPIMNDGVSVFIPGRSASPTSNGMYVAVATPSMSDGARPASSIACLQASRARIPRGNVGPAVDLRMADPYDRGFRAGIGHVIGSLWMPLASAWGRGG